RLFREHRESVGQASRHPNLPSIFIIEIDCDVLAKRRAAPADIDDYVAYPAAANSDQFPLRVAVLQVQSTHHPMSRARQIVLNETRGHARLRIAADLKNFHESAPRIGKALWLDNEDTGDVSRDNVH